MDAGAIVALRLNARDAELLRKLTAADGLNVAQVLRKSIWSQARTLGLVEATDEDEQAYIYRRGRVPRKSA